VVRYTSITKVWRRRLRHAALICFGVLDYLVEAFRLHRFGMEEACAVGSSVFLSVAAWLSTSIEALAVSVAALAAFGVFIRFGYLYAALGAIARAAVPFQSVLRVKPNVQADRPHTVYRPGLGRSAARCPFANNRAAKLRIVSVGAKAGGPA